MTAQETSKPNLVRQLVTFDTKHDEDTSDTYNSDRLIAAAAASPIRPNFDSKVGQESQYRQ